MIRLLLFGLLVWVSFSTQSFGFGSKSTELESVAVPVAPVSSISVRQWITKDDGAKFCVAGSGISLEQGKTDLLQAKIAVSDSKKGTDGRRHAQVCGGGRGSTNQYFINKDQLAQALALGYSELNPVK
jgi:hypothetical protein